jgi:hypothetical protein
MYNKCRALIWGSRTNPAQYQLSRDGEELLKVGVPEPPRGVDPSRAKQIREACDELKNLLRTHLVLLR